MRLQSLNLIRYYPHPLLPTGGDEDTLLRVSEVYYRAPVGGFTLEGINLSLLWGSFTLLVGKTGAGKTTLLKMINLLLRPLRGEITFYRFRLSHLTPSEKSLWRRRLGWVPQETELLYDRSVLDNVLLTARCDPQLGKPKKRALAALTQVGLAHKLHHNPLHLSGGERQRVAIARALVNQPFLLVADEPVAHLDPGTSAEVVDLFHHINLAGTAILIATHQPERFASLNPKVWVLENGQLKG